MVVGCWLFVVGCLLFVVCCLLFVVCCLLLVKNNSNLDFCFWLIDYAIILEKNNKTMKQQLTKTLNLPGIIVKSQKKLDNELILDVVKEKKRL